MDLSSEPVCSYSDTTVYLSRDWTKKEITLRKASEEVGLHGKCSKYVSRYLIPAFLYYQEVSRAKKQAFHIKLVHIAELLIREFSSSITHTNKHSHIATTWHYC